MLNYHIRSNRGGIFNRGSSERELLLLRARNNWSVYGWQPLVRDTIALRVMSKSSVSTIIRESERRESACYNTRDKCTRVSRRRFRRLITCRYLVTNRRYAPACRRIKLPRVTIPLTQPGVRTRVKYQLYLRHRMFISVIARINFALVWEDYERSGSLCTTALRSLSVVWHCGI